MKKVISFALVLIAIFSMTASASADSQTIYSDTSVTVFGPLDEYKPINDPAWGAAHQAVLTWIHPLWPALDPAFWISNTYYIEGNIAGDTWRMFRKTVDLCENAYDISGTITANSDNAEEVYVNGTFVGSEGTVQGPADNGWWWQTSKDYPYEATGDTLVFDFIVRNYAGSSYPESNPTGLIFQISVNYSCPLEVVIDIKPGSFPSCFNNNGNGLIPVAIFGSESFDVRDVDLSTVLLESLPVAMKPNGKYMAAYQDVDLDSYEDLVVKFQDEDGVFEPGDEFATLTGNLFDGTPFFGVGDICVRP
ncbi:MAG: hypothetical protein A2136_11160 [Chloroflexi bacterium RBG_16_54_11]|nr:MAG: hypothetical protein A2136_11160 [Chloroflexi bacterium RBG_16_54_11]